MAILASVTVSMGDEMKGVLRQTRFEMLWGGGKPGGVEGQLREALEADTTMTKAGPSDGARASKGYALGLEGNVRRLRRPSSTRTGEAERAVSSSDIGKAERGRQVMVVVG